MISAQKAYTANGFSRPSFALSTANLFTAVQPGGSLFGLQASNPVDPRVVYRGDSSKYGTAQDPMLGLKPGGINVFGGGGSKSPISESHAPPIPWRLPRSDR